MGIYILTSYLQLECTLHMKNLKKVQMINTTIYPSNKAVAKKWKFSTEQCCYNLTEEK